MPFNSMRNLQYVRLLSLSRIIYINHTIGINICSKDKY